MVTDRELSDVQRALDGLDLAVTFALRLPIDRQVAPGDLAVGLEV